jgi:hypothetical protein
VGIIAAAGYDYEVVEKVYKPHDNLALAAGNSVGIPLAIAAWFRYLLGVDDKLRPWSSAETPCWKS